MAGTGSAIGTVGGSAIGTAFGGPIGGQIGGALGGAIGGLFGGEPGKRRKNENYGKLRKAYSVGGAQNQEINQAYGQSAAQLGMGYGQALGAIGQMGQAERMQILQGQKQQIAELNQNMTNRGLYNTSIGAGAGQGYQNIRQNTQLALGNLTSQLAGLRANLYTQRGQALAGNTLGKLGAQVTTRGQYANVLSGPLAAPSGSWGTQNAPVNYEALGTLGSQIGNLFGGGGQASSGTTPGGTEWTLT